MQCLPLDNAVEQNSAISSHFNRALTTDVLKTNFKDTNDENAKENLKKAVEDLKSCWIEFIIYGIVALFLSLLVIFLLKWFTGVFTWGCLIIGIAFCAFATYYCSKQYANYPDTDQSKTWLSLAILFGLSTVAFIVIIIFLRKYILLTIAIYEETSKSVLSNVMSLFFPLVPWLLQIAVFAFTIYVALKITAIRESEYQFYGSQSSCKCTGEASGYKDGSICSLKLFESLCKENGQACTTASCSPKQNMYLFDAINAFGFLWLNFFLSAFEEMVLAGTFATWYFTFNKDDVPYFGILNSMMITTRYHIGTLAFGSLIVAIIRVIRMILNYFQKQLREGGNGSIAMEVCLCIVRCCTYCLEHIIRFINRNAYIMCAIHGTNFCTSAKNAFFLIMRNFRQIIVILNVTSFLIFVNEVLISLIVMTLAYFISFSDTTAFHFNWLPVVIVGIISLLVATIFFSVFSMGIDTLFICFLQDLERNDGSAQRPYYMSKNLMKVFNENNE